LALAVAPLAAGHAQDVGAPMPLVPPANESWGPAPGQTQSAPLGQAQDYPLGQSGGQIQETSPGGLRPDERQTMGGGASQLPSPDLPPMPAPIEVLGTPEAGATAGPMPAPIMSHGSTDPKQVETLADAQATVAEATSTVSRLRTDSGFKKELNQFLARARAVMVVPSFFKAGFVVGGAYGSAVLLVRDDQGHFSDPAFYTISAGSVGLQFGAQENELILLVMTDAGLNALMRDRFKLEAGASITFGIFGGGVSTGSTTDVNQDIIAFSHSRGLFGGGALEGAVVEPRQERNTAFYDSQQATPDAIVLARQFSNPSAAPLKAALTQPLTR